jgi:hypothetical protein
MYLNYPNKSVFLQGPITKKLVYKLCPSTEFSEGTWKLSLASISYSTIEQNNKDVFSITCNVVKSQKLSSSNEVENYDQTLNTFLLDTNKKRHTIYFNPHCFHINAISNEIKFDIKNVTNPQMQYQEVLVYLHVLFQKIM